METIHRIKKAILSLRNQGGVDVSNTINLIFSKGEKGIVYDGWPLSYHLDNSIRDIRTAIPFILASENIKVMGHTSVYMMQDEHQKVR